MVQRLDGRGVRHTTVHPYSIYTGIIIGDDAVLVADTQATPAMAADVVRRIRLVTDKPIKYVVLTHYHAVRVLPHRSDRPSGRSGRSR